MIITIDGPAGSGKSTVAKRIAEELDLKHLNSGSIFRGVTAYFLKHNVDLENIEASAIPELEISIRFIHGEQNVFINHENMTAHLRDNEVSIATPKVSMNPAIRRIIDDVQRNFASKNNIIVDGRDTGSHVFPNADYKFYLDCSIDERARRRFLEEKNKSTSITIEEIKSQIALRDEIDKNKKIAPLIIPDGAIIVDSTNLSVEGVVKEIIDHIR